MVTRFPTNTGAWKSNRSTVAVTTFRPEWRIATTPAASSASFMMLPPWTFPLMFASSGVITCDSTSRVAETGFGSPAIGSLFLRDQDDLDPAVLRLPLRGVVPRDRLVLPVGDRGELGGVDPLLLQVAGDVDGARRGQLPVGGEFLRQHPYDRHVVRVALDPDRLVFHVRKDGGDFSQDGLPAGFHLRLAGVEEDGVHHVDGQLALKFRYRHLPLGDLPLHLFHQVLVRLAGLLGLLPGLLQVGDLLT